MFFSVPLSSSLFPERCKPITRGVHPPSFQGPLISFHFGVLDLSLQQDTKKKGQHNCTEKEKTPLKVMTGKTVFPQGWIIKMLVAGETLHILLLTGILNINIFFIKKKNNVVVNSKIYDKVASKLLNYNVNYTNKFT